MSQRVCAGCGHEEDEHLFGRHCVHIDYASFWDLWSGFTEARFCQCKVFRLPGEVCPACRGSGSAPL